MLNVQTVRDKIHDAYTVTFSMSGAGGTRVYVCVEL